jgi:hypothetical protein
MGEAVGQRRSASTRRRLFGIAEKQFPYTPLTVSGGSADGSLVAEVVNPEAGYGVRAVTEAPHVRAIQVYAPQEHRLRRRRAPIQLDRPLRRRVGPEADTGMAILAPGEAVDYRVRLELPDRLSRGEARDIQ